MWRDLLLPTQVSLALDEQALSPQTTIALIPWIRALPTKKAHPNIMTGGMVVVRMNTFVTRLGINACTPMSGRIVDATVLRTGTMSPDATVEFAKIAIAMNVMKIPILMTTAGNTLARILVITARIASQTTKGVVTDSSHEGAVPEVDPVDVVVAAGVDFTVSFEFRLCFVLNFVLFEALDFQRSGRFEFRKMLEMVDRKINSF